MLMRYSIRYGVKSARSAIFAALAFGLAASAQAETRSYSYNARGELTSTTVSGGPANGVQSTSTYDAAGNRGTYQTTRSSSAPAYKTVVVVPINGLTPIIIPQ